MPFCRELPDSALPRLSCPGCAGSPGKRSPSIPIALGAGKRGGSSPRAEFILGQGDLQEVFAKSSSMARGVASAGGVGVVLTKGLVLPGVVEAVGGVAAEVDESHVLHRQSNRAGATGKDALPRRPVSAKTKPAVARPAALIPPHGCRSCRETPALSWSSYLSPISKCHSVHGLIMARTVSKPPTIKNSSNTRTSTALVAALLRRIGPGHGTRWFR